ncbi:GTPase [Streptomyces griseoaurantiacus]|uniref:50S ribosome-binding GTPase n=1 Tax=Streptomyces griseoaurantiacus TaxID=68213 RepID=A0A1G7IQ29_9ACTN|nr:GTPase domain-containing protein [Streptomyces jietaisiensis]SDF14725.1 50S ribosome-binding GTPase [Streptomyces jietaisiensis]
MTEAPGGTSPRTEILALLLEPLGVDAMAGQAALRRLAENVDAVARAYGSAVLPAYGSTLPWVSDAVSACVEEHELAGVTTDPEQARALRVLARLEGVRSRLPAFEGVPVDALRADLVAVMTAERLLLRALEPYCRADQDWPEEIWRSLVESVVDVDAALADLNRPRATRQAAAARQLVLQHSVSAARDLRNRDLAVRLEKVRDYVAARKAYEAFLSARPGWWRWLGPDARSGFRSDRRDALVWALTARDTGALPGSALELLATGEARAALASVLVPAPGPGVHTTLAAPLLPPPPATSSAARLASGLLAVGSRHDADRLRALESWYTKNLALFDRVAAAMDLREGEPALREALDPLVGELALPPGAVDTSRSDYRAVQAVLRAEVEELLRRARQTRHSEHAVESEQLVKVIGRVGTLERELRESMRPLPAVRGRLLVAVAGRTKSGKTTLRKALTRETDRSGIGRGAHRTTRRTSAFDVGPVTYLDTPGFAAKDDDFDAQHARAACDRADAVIWNYAETMRDEEAVEFRRLLLSGKPLLTVVNVKGKVDEPARLRFFADSPEREFRPAPEHTARIEQVARAAGAVPPVVLAVHSGAAHESLFSEDRELGDRALRASRLPELERALSRLLAERSIPLRAVRLAEEVRRPLAAFGDRAAQELPRIGLALDALERSMPGERAELLEVFRDAGRHAHERLEAERHQARERLPETVQGLGGEDHAQRCDDFFTGLGWDALIPALENELAQRARERGRALRLSASAPERQDNEHPHVEPLPDPKYAAAAVKGAATALLGSFSVAGLSKAFSKKAAATAGTAAATASAAPAIAVAYAAEALAGAAKAVSSEVGRARQAKEEWARTATEAAEASLDDLFDWFDTQLTRVVEEATAQVEAQFTAQTADIGSARERCERLGRLRSSVRSALDTIDLTLARRLLTLAGGDPAAVRRARRTPGVELRVWIDASRVADVRTHLHTHLVDVLTERIEVSPDSRSGEGDGTADHD